MSTRPLRRSTRDTRRSRRNVLEVDLNETPPPDDGGLQEAQPSQPVTYIPPPPPPPAAIDVEAIEDDEEVLISSPRSFAEARNKARRNRSVTVVLDEDSEVARTSRLNLNSNKKRRRIPTNQSTDFGLYINLEGTDSVKRAKCSEASQNVQAPPPPKEATFSCPVCMGQLSEETSTRCGHIFCKNCIKAAIAAQNKCPTCRRRITLRDTFRVYLPATG